MHKRKVCLPVNSSVNMRYELAWFFELFATAKSPDYSLKFDPDNSIHGDVQCCSKYVQGFEVFLRLCVLFYRRDFSYYLIWECQEQHTDLWTVFDCYEMYNILEISECISRYYRWRYHRTQPGIKFASFQIDHPKSCCPKVHIRPIKRFVISYPCLHNALLHC